MATEINSSTFSALYKDDFKDSANYHRILFNSGKALQARELTQLQTIIQEEVGRFGRNIFKEGAVVEPGGVTLNNRIEFIKLNTNSNPLPSNPKTLIGKTLTVKSPDPNLEVLVIDVVEAEGSDPTTLFVTYTDTQYGISSSSPIRVPDGAYLTGSGITDLKAANTGATGFGTRISNASGVFFTQGHFVFANPQTIYVDKYSSTPTEEIGFKVVETVVTVDDDVTLYDNQGDTPNLASPGADRYKISLELIKRSDLQASDNFVYLAKITEGRITDVADGENAYNKLMDIVALRTREESGNYVVKPFIAAFDELNDSNLSVNVSSGIAYVDGYRLDIPLKTFTLPRAQTTTQLTSQNIVAEYGNYVVGNASNNKGLPDVSVLEQVNLLDGTNYTGSTIGTARVRAVQEDGANHNYYLFDIQMNQGENFRDTRSFGTASDRYTNVVLDGGAAKLQGTTDNSLLFPLPKAKPAAEGVNITELTIQRRYPITHAGGTLNLSAGTGYTFTDAFQWVLSEVDGPVVTNVTYSGVGSSVTITNLPAGNYVLLAYVSKSGQTHKVKSGPQEATLTMSWPADAITEGDLRYIDLEKADIYEVTDIRINDANGDDLSDNFIIDNGQRDNYYAKGRLIEKGGVSLPSGNIYVKFKYFVHSTGGDYFSVNSYANTSLDYAQIPKYKKSNGEVISLAEVLDFRPIQDVNGTYSGGVIFPLPQNTDVISGTIDYYLGRKDRIVAKVRNSRDGRNSQGYIDLIQGIPGTNPQYPDIPTGSIPLYDIELNPYTINDSDLTTSFYANKRYTMKDISLLEQRLDDLTELTTLSLLELNTSSLEVLDSSGLARTKAGFFADNFSNYDMSETDAIGYRASISPDEGTLSVTQYPNNVPLFFDSTDVSQDNVVRSGDLLTLAYSHETLIDQNLCSEAINVNPFHVVTNNGIIELSPRSDNWVETRWAADKIVDGGVVTRDTGSTIQTTNLNNFRNSWFGTPVGDRVQVVTGSRVLRDIVGERVIDIEIIPFMRSIQVGFRAYGLRPFTRHFPFFGGEDISAWTREETSFIRFSSNPSNVGNTLTNATTHPNGAQALVSDVNGVIEGSFIVPSTPNLKFRTGQEVFKLLDVSINDETASTSRAKAIFTSSGVIETNQRTIRSTRQLDLANLVEVEPQRNEGDPVAQTFRIDQFENPRGVFLSKVDLFFKTKDPLRPVSVEIRTVENGIPTFNAIPGAVKFLTSGEVNVPVDTSNITQVRLAPTTFEFDEPIYLAPGQEYAIVVMTDSIEYNVYVAKTYDFVLGTTAARISRQPTLGTLLQSQNSSTWTPDQTRDLMFKLYRADFVSSGTGYINNLPTAKHLLNNNPLLVTSASNEVRVFHEGHGFMVNDKVHINGLDDSNSFGGIEGRHLKGTRNIEKVDWTGYTFNADSVASSTIRTGGSNVIVTQNAIMDAFVPTLQTNVMDRTSLVPSIQMTSASSYAAVSDDGRNSNLDGLAYSKDTTWNEFIVNEINYLDNPKLIASDSNETLNLGPTTSSLSIKLDFSTFDSKVSPVVDLQRSSITTFENIIDQQDSAETGSFNVPISFVPETHPTSGSSAAKHITKQVTLAEDAVGLNILFAANRPANSDFKVYYRTASADTLLDDVSWTEVNKVKDLPTDDNRSIFREYQYLPGGVGGNLLPFTKFQIKIVFTSTNSSDIPTIKDLRTIALVV